MKEPLQRWRFNFQVRGNSLMTEAWVPREGNTFKRYKVFCTNSSYYFVLKDTLEQNGERWLIDKVEKWDASKNNPITTDSLSDVAGCLKGAYSLLGVPLWQLLDDEKFIIKNITPNKLQPSFVDLEFHWAFPEELLKYAPGVLPEFDGIITLNPSKCWRVEETYSDLVVVRDSKEVRLFNNLHFDYRESPKGGSYYVYRTRTHNSENVFVKDKMPVLISEITKIDFSPVDKENFTLTHFGFPEPDFGGKSYRGSRYFLIVFGSLLTFIGLWRMYRSRKKRNEIV
ncbi:MAG: hypothetical protein LBQ66_05670 [Planctomycetaceae bacterium]|nr:hypothetical protein [Planctomycetaceae bacterium]